MGLSVAERIAQVAVHIARHDSHGYSQPHRSGDGTTESVTLSDGSKVVIHGGDYDCSEMVRVCVNCALGGDYRGPIEYMWTGNEDEELRAQGFVRIPYDYHVVRRGDVLLVSGHTGIALGDGMQADAHGDEYGGISGPSRGDQTGTEVEVRALRSTWAAIYRYAGEEPWLAPEPEPEKEQEQEERDMQCIISIKGLNTSVWFDGGCINDLTTPSDIAVLDKLASACTGKPLPRVELAQEEFAYLCQSIRGGYPKHLRKLVEKYAPRSPEGAA